ncbi:MAG TPA: heavy metal translocating P-type ATPase [Trebonia sp.]|nr:heavy metal translocating P-type ATPase [Trebonia sp.]
MTSTSTGTVRAAGAAAGHADQDAGAGPAELVITGMTCSACAVRIERRLNKLDGVAATVSFATGRAYLTSLGGREVTELIAVVSSVGYQAALPAPADGDGEEADPETRALARRLAVCAPLAVVVAVLAMVPAVQFTGWQWVSLALAAPVATWGAWPLHRAALAALRQATATMDTLVSVAVIAATGWSVYALAFGGAGMLGMRMPFEVTFALASGQTLYLEAAAGVTAAVLAGRYLESRARRHSRSAVTGLAALAARSAAVLRDGAEYRVPAAELAAGELFVVRPGERIAADGVVAEGTSAVDASLVTGEPVPAEVGPGTPVTGGTVNMSGRLVIRATRVGADTQLAQIARLVSRAQGTKASVQRLADRIAAIFVPCVISLAATTLGFWLGTGMPAAAAWSAAVAVLVVACPCALGLATPAALAAAVGRAAELGILVRSAQEIEAGRRIRVIALDKTGTLTAGKMTVTRVMTCPGTTQDEALLLAGAAEDGSEHPVGQAIARDAAARAGLLPPVSGFTALPGAGVRGTVGGRAVVVGNPGLFTELALDVPASLHQAMAAATEAGHIAVLAGWDGQARAVIVLADELRPGAAQAVARIRQMGLRPVMLTGDSRPTALAVASQLGIPGDSVFAGAGPAAKAEIIRQLQDGGQLVAFAGDGVNDAAALAQADLGIAAGTATDIASSAAGLTLTSGDPATIATALELARVTMRVIRVNLAWAFGYNLAAIPVAALGYLNPMLAGIAMSASSLIVVASSLRLRRLGARQHGPRRLALRRLALGRPALRPLRRSRRQPVTRPSRLARLARPVAAPVACAIVLTGVLSAWVAADGAGTLTRDSVQVTLAAVPMRASTPSMASIIATAPTYLTIRNLRARPDELLAVRSPAARHVTLIQRSVPGGPSAVAQGLVIPGNGTLTLDPVADDAVLQDPALYEQSTEVQLTLVFRNAGTITIEAPVTIPGTP